MEECSNHKSNTASMEETRKVALAYYANCSDKFKQAAREFFNAIDADGSGKISRYEYESYFNGIGKNFNAKVFAELDCNGDQFLDFEESIVFFYMVHFGNFWCDNCGEYLMSVYFTCSDCFLTESCYDLCVTCFGSKKFKHEHQDFIDNHAMLNITRFALQDVEKELQTHTIAVSNTGTADTQTEAVSDTGTADTQTEAVSDTGTVDTRTVAVSNTETAVKRVRKRDEFAKQVVATACEVAIMSQCSIM